MCAYVCAGVDVDVDGPSEGLRGMCAYVCAGVGVDVDGPIGGLRGLLHMHMHACTHMHRSSF